MTTLKEFPDTGRHKANPQAETSRRSDAMRNATVNCHACERSNSAAQKYCTECGQLLWEPCVVCATTGPVGQVYCGSCGSHMDTARRNKVNQFEKQLAEAERLRGESRFPEAMRILKKISDAPFSCVAKEAQRAKQLLKTCEEEGRSALEKAEQLAAHAEKLMQETDCRAAVDLLRRIPQTVRSDAIRSMLAKAEGILGEVARLHGEIETAMNSRLTSNIPAKLNRLLELQPENEKAQAWAKKLKQRVFAAARENFQQFHYDKAEYLLKMIPRTEVDRHVEDLLRETADLADMQWDIRKSTLIDDQLPAIAELLARRAPHHPHASGWLEAMVNRSAAAGRDVQQGLPRWVAAPRQPWIGCPLDRPTGFQAVEVGAAAAELLCRRHAGRFYVACGLALQGLAQAAFDMNLIPAQKSGILRQMSRLRSSRRHELAWGLDLGASGLKAVKMAWDAQREKVKIEDCFLAEFPGNIEDIVDEGEKETLIVEALKNFRQKHPPENECVAVSLPGRLTLYRVLELPAMDRKKLDAAVQYEARRVFPFPLEQLVWGFRPLGKQIILLAAAKRSFVEEQLAVFRRADVRVDILQSDLLALINHFNFESPEKGSVAFCRNGPEGAAHKMHPIPFPGPDDEAVAVFDVGSNTSNFLVYSPTCVWVHSAGLGSSKINHCLMRRFGISAAAAEALKRRPPTAESLRQWHEAVRPVFDSLAKEISWSTDMFARAHPGVKLTQILGTGGGFQAHGLLRYLYHGR